MTFQIQFRLDFSIVLKTVSYLSLLVLPLLDLKLDWRDPEREVGKWLTFLINLYRMCSHSHPVSF